MSRRCSRGRRPSASNGTATRRSSSTRSCSTFELPAANKTAIVREPRASARPSSPPRNQSRHRHRSKHRASANRRCTTAARRCRAATDPEVDRVAAVVARSARRHARRASGSSACGVGAGMLISASSPNSQADTTTNYVDVSEAARRREQSRGKLGVISAGAAGAVRDRWCHLRTRRAREAATQLTGWLDATSGGLGSRRRSGSHSSTTILPRARPRSSSANASRSSASGYVLWMIGLSVPASIQLGELGELRRRRVA